MEYLYSFVVALFLTIALIPVLIRSASRLKLVDVPTASRKIHVQSMPRSGGIAIFLGTMLPLLFLLPLERQQQGFLVGCLVIFVSGILDDRFELNFKWKLVGQALAALAVMSSGIMIQHVPFLGLVVVPGWCAWLLTLTFIVGVINGVNFSDGLDGLAGGTIMMALLVVALLGFVTGQMSSTLISVTVAGAVLGFLRYNTFPARIFMGDGGSQFLGFVAVCQALVISQGDTSALSSFVPLLVLGLPILDIVQVVVVRIKKRLPLPGPDKEHFHHQLLKLGFYQYEVVAIIYLLQATLLVVAWLLRYGSATAFVAFYSSFFVLVLGPLYFAHRQGWRIRVIDPAFVRHERRHRLLRRLGWVHRHATVVIQILVGIYFLAVAGLVGPLLGRGSWLIVSLIALCVAAAAAGSRVPRISGRIISYSTCAAMVYFVSTAGAVGPVCMAFDIYLAGLALFLMLAIRVTRKEEFRLDTQDLLVFCLVLLLPQLPLPHIPQISLGEFTLRLAVLLYACEYAVSKKDYRLSWSSGPAIAGLVLIGLLG